ncbi:MAG: hypothetical protein ABIR24_05815, partial [Verrucomicrobiota bacterium]
MKFSVPLSKPFVEHRAEILDRSKAGHNIGGMRFSLVLALFLVGCGTVSTRMERGEPFVPAPNALDGITQARAEKLVIGGGTAFIASAEKPAHGQPWVWYAPTFIG